MEIQRAESSMAMMGGHAAKRRDGDDPNNMSATGMVYAMLYVASLMETIEAVDAVVPKQDDILQVVSDCCG